MGDLIILRDTFDEAIASFKSEIVKPRPIEEVLKDLKKVDPILKLVEKESPNALRNVLGIIEGPYFVPDGKSRNKRYYPKKLWERVIREEGPSIERKGRLGTLEHPEKPEDEHPRQASHVLKKIWIEGRLGYGRSYVLNTPIGAIVSAIFSATDEHGKPIVPIYMSSRAVGRYLPGATHEGMPVVDPDKYVFQTFDVVINPGFLEANPEFIATVEACIGEVCESSRKPPKFYVPKPEGMVREAERVIPQVEETVKLTEELSRLNEELEKLNETLRVIEAELFEKNVSLLAIRFGIPTSKARWLLERMSYEDAVDFLAKEPRNDDGEEVQVVVENTAPSWAKDSVLRSVVKRAMEGEL